MFNWINQMLTLLLDYKVWSYWLPVALCLIGYILITVEDYQKDVKNRDEDEKAALENTDPNGKRAYRPGYTPKLTAGIIIGRFVVSFIPVINVLLTVFKFFPRLAGDIIKAFGKWLDIPLVPKRTK